MDQIIKMGRVKDTEFKMLQRLSNREERAMARCNLLKDQQDSEEYKQAKKELDQIKVEIEKWFYRIINTYRIEIIPTTTLRIDFENGDILAVIPKEQN